MPSKLGVRGSSSASVARRPERGTKSIVDDGRTRIAVESSEPTLRRIASETNQGQAGSLPDHDRGASAPIAILIRSIKSSINKPHERQHHAEQSGLEDQKDDARLRQDRGQKGELPQCPARSSEIAAWRKSQKTQSVAPRPNRSRPAKTGNDPDAERGRWAGPAEEVAIRVIGIGDVEFVDAWRRRLPPPIHSLTAVKFCHGRRFHVNATPSPLILVGPTPRDAEQCQTHGQPQLPKASGGRRHHRKAAELARWTRCPCYFVRTASSTSTGFEPTSAGNRRR